MDCLMELKESVLIGQDGCLVTCVSLGSGLFNVECSFSLSYLSRHSSIGLPSVSNTGDGVLTSSLDFLRLLGLREVCRNITSWA